MTPVAYFQRVGYGFLPGSVFGISDLELILDRWASGLVVGGVGRVRTGLTQVINYRTALRLG